MDVAKAMEVTDSLEELDATIVDLNDCERLGFGEPRQRGAYQVCD